MLSHIEIPAITDAHRSQAAQLQHNVRAARIQVIKLLLATEVLVYKQPLESNVVVTVRAFKLFDTRRLTWHFVWKVRRPRM